MARGDGSIYEREGGWLWLSYYHRGEQIREAAKDRNGKNTNDPKVARKFLRSRIKQIHAEECGGPAFVTPAKSRLTIHDLTEALRSDYELRGKLSGQSASHLDRVDRDFGEVRAVALTAEKIDAYVRERINEGDAASSINRTCQLLGQSYKLAIRRGHLAHAPAIRHLSEAGNERQGFLEPAEFSKLLAVLPDDGLRDFAEWSYITGQRKGETSQLTWSMVDDGELRIPGTICKNGRDRVLPITGRLAEILKRRQAQRNVSANGLATMTEHIFHRGDGGPIKEFRKTWRSACRKAGVSVLFHDLRRSSVRNSIRAGVSPQVARELSGHRTESMFARYNILTTDDLREAQRKTEEYRKNQEQKIVSMT